MTILAVCAFTRASVYGRTEGMWSKHNKSHCLTLDYAGRGPFCINTNTPRQMSNWLNSHVCCKLPALLTPDSNVNSLKESSSSGHNSESAEEGELQTAGCLHFLTSAERDKTSQYFIFYLCFYLNIYSQLCICLPFRHTLSI